VADSKADNAHVRSEFGKLKVKTQGEYIMKAILFCFFFGTGNVGSAVKRGWRRGDTRLCLSAASPVIVRRIFLTPTA
jgi:hypothetical protein